MNANLSIDEIAFNRQVNLAAIQKRRILITSILAGLGIGVATAAISGLLSAWNWQTILIAGGLGVIIGIIAISQYIARVIYNTPSSKDACIDEHMYWYNQKCHLNKPTVEKDCNDANLHWYAMEDGGQPRCHMIPKNEKIAR